MAHCDQYSCRSYRTVYNKKRSIYKNQYPLLHVNWTFFFFSFHSKRSKNILLCVCMCVWVGWGGAGCGGGGHIFFILFNIVFLLFFFFFFYPQPRLILPPCRRGGGGVISGCGRFIAVWGSTAGRGGVVGCWGGGVLDFFEMTCGGSALHAVKASLNSLFLRTS